MKLSIKKLMLLTLILLPFEAIPHIMPSIYRPISVYPLSIMGVVYLIKNIKNNKINRIDLDFIVFGIYAIVSGIMLSYLKFNSLSAFMDFLLTFILGLFSFFGANYGFEKFRQAENSNEEYIYTVLSFLSKVYTFVLIIGVIELLCELGILPHAIIRGIYTFSGGRQYNRVCLLSAEASWASIHIILMFVIFYFKLTIDKKNIYIINIAFVGIIFIYNMSGQGILIACTMVFVYLIIAFFVLHNKKIIKFGLIFTIVIILGYFLIQTVLPYMSSSYYVNRLRDFTNINNMIHNDGSSFVRLVYPKIAVLIFFNNILFGIGAGNFCNMLGVYINKYYSWALIKYQEVYQHVLFNIEQTGCLYTRLLSETGIVGTILFMKPVINILKKVKYVCDSYYINIILLVLTLTISSVIQMDSFVYEIFWVMLAFVNNLTKERQA